MSERIRPWLLGFFTSLWIIFTGIFIGIALSPILHRFQAVAVTGLTPDEIAENYQAMVDYLWLWHRQPLALPDFKMSAHGVIHFAEVKRLLDGMQIFYVILTPLVLGFGFYFLKKQKPLFLKDAAVINVILFVTFTLVALTFFDEAFVLFHRLVFHNDYWVFDWREDPVILILPEDFFLKCFLLILFVIIVLTLLAYVLYRYNEKKLR